MSGIGWWARVRYSLLGGLLGWLIGVVVTIPFEAGVASRYLEGQHGSMVHVLAGGMLVWGAFALFMAAIAWVLLVLPVALFIPPAWIVRRRHILIPLSAPAAALAMGLRLHIFEHKNFVSMDAFLAIFWIAPNVFAMVFAPVLTAVYAWLAQRRLRVG